MNITRTTEVSVKETNDHGYGFTCKVSVDSGMPHVVSFDIAWQHTDEDGDTEDIETVGVIMTPTAANAIADQMRECAYRVEQNLKIKEDTTNG